MSDQQIPDEAIEAQRAYDAADSEVQRLTALMPSGVAVAAGDATIPEELAEQLRQARTARLDRLEELRGLPWWETVESPLKVEAALRKAARPGSDVPPDAA